MENVVTDVVTISEVVIRNAFTNDNGIKIIPVTVNTVERVSQFQKNTSDDGDEVKVLKRIRQVPNVNLSDLTRIFALNPYLSLIRKSNVDDITDDTERLNVMYEDHLRLLGSAKLTFERVEKRNVVYTDKPILDENGDPKKDKNDDIMYQPELDDKDNPVTTLVGYGETTFIKLDLTEPAYELAKYLAKNKKVEHKEKKEEKKEENEE